MRRDWAPEDPGPADLRAGQRRLFSVLASAYFTLRLATRTRALGHLLGLPTVGVLRSYILDKVGPLTLAVTGVGRVAESTTGDPDVMTEVAHVLRPPHSVPSGHTRDE
jgi:hypothetical protein